MIAETSIVEKYARSGIEARLNFVLEHFDGMMELVDFFEKDLCEKIREDKLFNRRKLTGNTGIRVQTSGLSDTTFRDAERNVSLIQQIRSGSIDELLRDTDEDVVKRIEIISVRMMRSDYDSVHAAINILKPRARMELRDVLAGRKDLGEIAECTCCQYDSAKKRLYRNRRKVKELAIILINSRNRKIA